MTSFKLQAGESHLKILCLDGGGVRSLSSLLILEDIMHRIKELEGLSEIPSPCEIFDFIGGTGTGGIIAIMLGRLGMSVDESIHAYKLLTKTVIAPESTLPKTFLSTYSTTKIKTAIKQMVCNNRCGKECVLQRENLSPTSENNSCPHEDMLFWEGKATKTAVLAMTKANLETSPTLLTSYSTSGSFTECRIWEVARAISADVTLFDSVKLGRDDIELVGASYGYNNPCEVLVSEAKKQFPNRETITLSIGTGLGNVVEIDDSKDSVSNALLKMATTSKQIDLRLKEMYASNGVYHRFNVEIGLEDTKISDCLDMGKISAHTSNYLNENYQLVRQFVTDLALRAYHDEKDKECLSEFFITDPRANREDIETRKGGLLEHSYHWLLEHESYKRFLKEDSGILWIKGDPGKGKTMLLCGVIRELEKQELVPFSYFFCQAGINQANTDTSVLRGLIYDLAIQYPQLIRHARDKYDYMGKKLFSDNNAWHQLCEIVTAMLYDPSLRNPVLIVDALDECNDWERLLKFITKPSPAKWIVSSRNLPGIEETLDYEKQKNRIHLEMNQGSVSAAVDSYIKEKVTQLAEKKKYNDKMKVVVLDHLRSNANGTFLWVALVYQELSNQDTRTWDTKDILTAFPPELGPLYQRMLRYMYKSKRVQKCEDILSQLLVMYQPIALEELCVLVQALEGMDKQEIEDAIASCGSFLTVHKNTISFVHQSAKEFLLQEAHLKILPLGIQHQHQKVLLRSLELLHGKLEHDICRFQAPGCLANDIQPPKIDLLDAIQYSCIFWVDHLCHSDVNDLSMNDKILAFFNEKYLQWLEALSILKKLSIAGRAMEKLVRYSEKKASHNLQAIIKDGHRFLLAHGGAIEVAPSQVYISALVFSPTNSLIRERFSRHQPHWIELKPRVEANWDACLQTLEGHDYGVISVVFSKDGQRLASGSDDSTVKIWDASSGTCLHTLEGHFSCVTSVVFSPDGQWLASGSDDETVKIWDLTSGACIKTLEGHQEEVRSVVFLNDKGQLASGSYDRTIKIWDTASGACIQTLEGHCEEVTSVAFSNDGKQLASGSNDETVKIWNATSGAFLRTLGKHDRRVTSVAFSNDGKRLASGSDDRTAKVWDVTSSECLQTFEGHDSYVTSVVFSNNDQRMVSGSDDKTVKIWDVTSGACLQTFRSHDRRVTSVVSSNDGQRLASGSNDKTIKIWNATSDAFLRTLEGHCDYVTSAVFSNDGNHVASGSCDHTIKIWNARSGECQKILESHKDNVTSVTFSKNGQRLVSGSSDKTVKIWDVTLGTHTTLKAHYKVKSVAFSNDEARLASGLKNKTIKIWDMNSGVPSQVLKLKGHCASVTSVSFSSDGRQLASGSEDKSVRIWDTTSGGCLHDLRGHCGYVTSVIFSNDRQQLASASSDKTVKIWDATFGVCLQTFEGHDGGVTSVVFSNDAQRLASGSLDKTVKIWDVISGVCLQTFQSHDRRVTSVSFSGDGQRLASGSKDRTVKIWNATSSAFIQTSADHNDWVTSVVFSNDEQRLASGSHDKTVKVWNATSGACLRTFKGHHSHVMSVAFSHDAKRLASGSKDRTVKIWDPTSSVCLRTLDDHDDVVTSVVFSNDGMQLASGSSDKTIKIWDVNSGDCLKTLKGHDYSVTSLVFSNEGQHLASRSNDGTAKIWDVTSGLCRKTLQVNNCKLTSLIFSSEGQHLASEASLDSTSSPNYKDYSYSISRDDVWIMHGQGRVLWLPPSYRPVASAVVNSKIALGSSSGRVIILGLKSTN